MSKILVYKAVHEFCETAKAALEILCCFKKNTDKEIYKVDLKVSKILVYKVVHEFCETAQSCFRNPLLLQEKYG